VRRDDVPDRWSHNHYGDEFARVYDRWYPPDDETVACADSVVSAARGGRVLELGAGTGRVTLVVARRCTQVVAVDNSAAMLEGLLARAPANVWVEFGHMVRDMPEGPFDAVLCTDNTLFNLVADGEQRSAFAAVAQRLARGGAFLAACTVPHDADEPTSTSGTEIRLGEVVDSTATIDPRRHVVSGEYTVRGAPPMRWQLRWTSPDDLDTWAGEHGMRLVARWSTWSREPFVRSSTRHVSIWTLDEI